MLQMYGAGAILASFAIPAITIACDPAVDVLRERVNPGHLKKPGYQLPSRQRQADARPGICAGIHAPAGVDGLHQAHRFIEIYLRKASGHAGVVKIEQLDTAPWVHAPHTRDTRAAQIAGPIVKHGKFGHSTPGNGES